MLRLWNVTTTCQELSHIAAPFVQDEEDDEDGGLVPSQIAVDNTTIVVLYDQSTRVDVYEITNQDTNGETQYRLQWIQTLRCPGSPLSGVAVRGDTSTLSSASFEKTSRDSFWLLCREPVYLLKLEISRTLDGIPTFHWNDSTASVLALRLAFTGTVATKPGAAIEAVKGGESADHPVIVMPTSIWERDANGLLKVAKVHDKRFAGSADTQLPTPWNRADRIEIARQRNLRHKKRRQEKSEIRYRQRQEEKKQKQQVQQQEASTATDST